MTRVDLMCTDRAPAVARAVTRQWCRARALSVDKSEEVALLASEAVSSGLRMGPRTARLELFWEDTDLARFEAVFTGLRSGAARVPQPSSGVAEALLEALSVEWGKDVASTLARHWFVFDSEIGEAIEGV